MPSDGGGQRRLRAIEVECPDCGSGPFEPCVRKSELGSLDFRASPIKTLHPGRYFEASFLRSVSTRSVRDV